MNRTSIEWTDFTSNALKYRDAAGNVVWACVHASPGCQHCYAETLAKRYRRGGPFNVPTTAKVTPFLDEAELRRMLTHKPASGKRCFVGDMTDVFGEWVPDALLDRLFAVFALRPDVTWQVLTKRADRMRTYVNSRVYPHVGIRNQAILLNSDNDPATPNTAWPLPNVWLGVSCEDQQRANERIPLLLQTPAAVRYISAEPLLGPIDLNGIRWETEGSGGPAFVDVCGGTFRTIGGHGLPGPKLDWLIVGGESGPGARPCDVAWIRAIVEQCASAGTPCFVKQLGSSPYLDSPCAGEPGDVWTVTAPSGGTAIVLKSRKGGDPAEWPETFRVRQFPRAAVPA